MSPSKFVAFVNSKGGVGKSTIAVNYAVAETERGRRVAVIDSDVQESSTRWLKELTDGISVHRLPTPDDVLEEAPKLKEHEGIPPTISRCCLDDAKVLGVVRRAQ